MYHPTSIDTPYHIDLATWQLRRRNFGRFLCEILGDDDGAAAQGEPIDYIDPETAEVYTLDSLWVRILVHRAGRPDYITAATPMTNAVLRALIENRNQPMTAVELHRRINRASPETVLSAIHAVRDYYCLAPVDAPRRTAKRGK